MIAEPFLVAGSSRLLDTPTAELVIARHANAARAEYVQLGDEVLALAQRAGVDTQPWIACARTWTPPSRHVRGSATLPPVD